MKHSFTITLFLIALFLGAQYIGLAVVNSYINVEATRQTGNLTVYNLPSVAGMQMDRPEMEGTTSLAYIVGAVLIGTLLILLIIKYAKFYIWKVWFLIVVAMCLYFAVGKWISPTIAGIIAIIFAVWKVFKPNFIVHNLTELFIYGGLAAILFPILAVWNAAVLLILISLYDMYAVWRSKHMVTLATAQKSEGVFAGLMLPYSWKTPFKTVASSKAPSTEAHKHGSTQTAILGGGDIGFPLLFASAFLKQSVLAATFPWAALLIPLFAALALFLLLVAAKKDRFYPAMPFITAGCAVGWLISLLF